MSNYRFPRVLLVAVTLLLSTALGVAAPVNSSVVDGIVKDVCVDGADRPLLVDPFKTGCPPGAVKRKLRVGASYSLARNRL